MSDGEHLFRCDPDDLVAVRNSEIVPARLGKFNATDPLRYVTLRDVTMQRLYGAVAWDKGIVIDYFYLSHMIADLIANSAKKKWAAPKFVDLEYGKGFLF
jgi:hypothetical protein